MPTTTSSLSAGGAYRRAVDALPMSLRRMVRYQRSHGRVPSLLRPRTFTEKVTWRMLRDRRPQLAWTCDKERMKEHARATAPPGVRVPRTLWAGTDLGELRGRPLPEHWVLKPNHRTGLFHLGRGAADVPTLRELTAGWLEPKEWTTGGEWAYSRAEPLLIVEERIGGADADLADYKVYVFDGVPRMVQVVSGRQSGHETCVLYSPDWEPMGGVRIYATGEPEPAPRHLARMREAAALIGAGFDFIRVDLYLHDDEIWFGELTPYPGSGLVPFEPRSLDAVIGSWWRLPARTSLPEPTGAGVTRRRR